MAGEGDLPCRSDHHYRDSHGKDDCLFQEIYAFCQLVDEIQWKSTEIFHGPGDEHAYEFDDKVLFKYAEVKDGLDLTKDDLSRASYQLIKP